MPRIRAYRHANQLPFQVERTILQLKEQYPSWRAPKIREKLVRRYPMIQLPATSTIHAVLDRHGLVKKKNQGGIELKELNYTLPRDLISYGVLITKASLCSEIRDIATL